MPMREGEGYLFLMVMSFRPLAEGLIPFAAKKKTLLQLEMNKV